MKETTTSPTRLPDEIQAWFAERIPDAWFTRKPDVTVDGEEILVVGTLPVPTTPTSEAESTAGQAAARITTFREETRERRIGIAEEAERLYRRKVSWGAVCGEVERTFTALAVPVMTRLRIQERQALDTLIEAGVARSRSEALAWCVRMVRQNEEAWLADLRDALVAVQQVRAEGPTAI